MKIAVGLSGGIDSSYSAYLLKNMGYDIVGVYMKLHDIVPSYHEKNIKNIKKISNFLNIPYHILELEDRFKTEVYDYFIDSYQQGKTPNPCIKCNSTIKFGLLFDEVMKLGVDMLSTGHYVKTDGKFIYEAADKQKDQSYFLGQVKQSVLPKLIFPLKNLTKLDIVKKCQDIDILKDIATSGESQEICFVEENYIKTLKNHIAVDKAGVVIDNMGKDIGTHKGYMHYTVGKRKGFYVHGALTPHYVLKTDKINNTITVGSKDQLRKNVVKIKDINSFIEDKTYDCKVKLRYRTKAVRAKVKRYGKKAIIYLDEFVYGVAVGQFAVCYDNDKLISSGEIVWTYCRD